MQGPPAFPKDPVAVLVERINGSRGLKVGSPFVQKLDHVNAAMVRGITDGRYLAANWAVRVCPGVEHLFDGLDVFHVYVVDKPLFQRHRLQRPRLLMQSPASRHGSFSSFPLAPGHIFSRALQLKRRRDTGEAHTAASRVTRRWATSWRIATTIQNAAESGSPCIGIEGTLRGRDPARVKLFCSTARSSLCSLRSVIRV